MSRHDCREAVDTRIRRLAKLRSNSSGKSTIISAFCMYARATLTVLAERGSCRCAIDVYWS
ncbi:MAG TPA: hypothetical protein VLK32_06370 [Bacillota bacterium]|nr:hypothetical protein [Bacillota bacterium]